MSLLADLLSKRNNPAQSGGKDIPPTLTSSYDTPIKVIKQKSRYVTITVVTVAIIVSGVLAMTQFSRVTALLTHKTTPTPQPVKLAATASPVASVAEVVVARPTPVEKAEPEKAAVPTQQTETTVKQSNAKSRHVHRRLAAVQPAPKKIPAQHTVPVTPRAEEVLSGKVDTEKRDALLYAARSAEQASDWRVALANYRKALKIDPDNFVIMNNAAAALNNLGMFDEGVKEAKRSLAKKPDYVPAMINAAIAYSSKGNSQEALRLFSEATIADPGNRSLVINLGILQERSGKLDDALKTYRPLADDGDPLALQGMGRVYERKGNRSEAVRAYRQIIATPNANPALKKEIKGQLVRLEEQ